MVYLIGTDEAGYGPNLGPLVISASVWQVPDGAAGDDLYRLLGSCVTPAPGPAAQDGSPHVAIADSKVLYQPAGGLCRLERGLLAALAVLDRRPTCWHDVWDALSSDSFHARRSMPWYADYDATIPVEADPAETERLARSLRQGLAAAGVRLVELRAKALFAEQFNRLVEGYGSKGAALSHTTLDLLSEIVGPLEERPIRIVCDKHGGRNRYRHLLSEHFPESLITIHGESRQRSVYRFGPPARRLEIRFQRKAESYLPAALASMASKYLRELAMRALNDFWCARIRGLRPTAGYPQDAKRFKAQIAAAQAELGIDDRLLWRVK